MDKPTVAASVASSLAVSVLVSLVLRPAQLPAQPPALTEAEIRTLAREEATRAHVERAATTRAMKAAAFERAVESAREEAALGATRAAQGDKLGAASAYVVAIACLTKLIAQHEKSPLPPEMKGRLPANAKSELIDWRNALFLIDKGELKQLDARLAAED